MSRTDDSCRLSTVDRFQGDEADIVIISLVKYNFIKTTLLRLISIQALLTNMITSIKIVVNVTVCSENHDKHCH